MKKTLSLFLSLLLALFCVSSVRGIKAEPVSITVDAIEADPGAEVSVSVRINGDYLATALTLALDYDASLLQLNGSLVHGEVWNEIVSAGGMAMNNIQQAGSIRFTAITYNENSFFNSCGILFTAKFTVSTSAVPGTVIPLHIHVDQFTFDDISGSVINIYYTVSDGSVTVSAPQPAGLPGDVDCNGAIDMSDVSMLFSYLSGGNIQISEQGMINADVNNDGYVSVMDTTGIFFIIANS